MKLPNYRSIGKCNGHYWAQMFDPLFRRNLVVLWIVTNEQVDKFLKGHDADPTTHTASPFMAFYEGSPGQYPFHLICLGKNATVGSVYHEALHCALGWPISRRGLVISSWSQLLRVKSGFPISTRRTRYENANPLD